MTEGLWRGPGHSVHGIYLDGPIWLVPVRSTAMGSTTIGRYDPLRCEWEREPSVPRETLERLTAWIDCVRVAA